jgi:FkbM family methyltransferase
MNLKTVELYADGHRLTLHGAHPAYLDSIMRGRQWSNSLLMRLVRKFPIGRQWNNTPLLNLVKQLPVGATYLDVGANIGLTGITGAAVRPDINVVAFEPVASNADLLAQNIRANKIANCTVVRSAVGDVERQLTMSDNGPWSVVDAAGAGAVQVPATTLDAWCRDHLPNTKIDLIKIDVEGYEPSVLAGAQQTISRWSPVIFMEFNAWTLVLGGHNPLVFAQAIWQAFHVESEAGVALADPVAFTHENMVRRGCVDDIVLRLCSPPALAGIASI